MRYPLQTSRLDPGNKAQPQCTTWSPRYSSKHHVAHQGPADCASAPALIYSAACGRVLESTFRCYFSRSWLCVSCILYYFFYLAFLIPRYTFACIRCFVAIPYSCTLFSTLARKFNIIMDFVSPRLAGELREEEYVVECTYAGFHFQLPVPEHLRLF